MNSKQRRRFHREGKLTKKDKWAYVDIMRVLGKLDLNGSILYSYGGIFSR